MHFERQSAIEARDAWIDLRARIHPEALKTPDVRRKVRQCSEFFEACIREAPATSDHSKELSETIKTNKADAKEEGGGGSDEGDKDSR